MYLLHEEPAQVATAGTPSNELLKVYQGTPLSHLSYTYCGGTTDSFARGVEDDSLVSPP
jgi:hypothetical protein